MQTFLDCIPCIIRQTVEVVRRISADQDSHERTIREVLAHLSSSPFDDAPPIIVSRIHRRIRELTGVGDMYEAAKAEQNALALSLFPRLEEEIRVSPDPLIAAARIAIAGNVIDLGVNARISEAQVIESLHQALTSPFSGDTDQFKTAARTAKDILYITDNAGEIVFDRLLIERLSPARVTVAVRGYPALNDALENDARTAGIDRIARIINNGTDIPGTVLENCGEEFRAAFASADLIISKGQGNYETLSDTAGNIFFLFCVKCPVIERHVGLPMGTQVLKRFPVSSGSLS